jgi:hypothetical protein
MIAMKFKIVYISLIFFSLNTMNIYAQEFLLDTEMYSDDEGETFIRKPTKFIINLEKLVITVTQSGQKIL